MEEVRIASEMSVSLNVYASVVHGTIILFCRPKRKKILLDPSNV